MRQQQQQQQEQRQRGDEASTGVRDVDVSASPEAGEAAGERSGAPGGADSGAAVSTAPGGDVRVAVTPRSLAQQRLQQLKRALHALRRPSPAPAAPAPSPPPPQPSPSLQPSSSTSTQRKSAPLSAVDSSSPGGQENLPAVPAPDTLAPWSLAQSGDDSRAVSASAAEQEEEEASASAASRSFPGGNDAAQPPPGRASGAGGLGAGGEWVAAEAAAARDALAVPPPPADLAAPLVQLQHAASVLALRKLSRVTKLAGMWEQGLPPLLRQQEGAEALAGGLPVRLAGTRGAGIIWGGGGAGSCRAL